MGIRILVLFGCVLLSMSYAAKANNPRLDSLLASLEGLSDTLRVDSVIKIARLSSIENDYTFSLEAAKWGHQQADQLGYDGLRAKARFYVAYSFQLADSLDSCVHHYEACLDELKGNAFEGWENYVYGNLSFIHQNFGLYEKALEYQLLSLDYTLSRNDTAALPVIYLAIGYTHDRLGNYAKALEWNRKAQNDARQLKDTGSYYDALLQIGICYDELGQYDSAHYYNNLTLEYYESVGDLNGVKTQLSNIGNTLMKQEKWLKALPILERARSICQTIDEQGGYLGNHAIVYLNLGAAYQQLNQPTNALEAYTHGIQLATQNSEAQFLAEGYEKLYGYYENQGNADSALHYLKLFQVIDDSLYNLQKTAAIANMEARYETEQKEKRNLQQQLTIQEQQNALQRQQGQMLGLGVLAFVVVLFGVLYYVYYKNKQRRILKDSLLQERERGIDQVFQAVETERRRIATDLHDGIGQKLASIKMSARHIASDQPSTGALQQLEQLIESTAKEARSISHQMMPKALAQLGLLAAVSDTLDQLDKHSPIQFEFEYFNLQERYPEKIEVALYRIFQELINNVLKHANATTVSVQLYQTNDQLLLVVEDNGKGFDPETTQGGLGLANIRNRIATLNGKFNVASSPTGTASTVVVSLLGSAS